MKNALSESISAERRFLPASSTRDGTIGRTIEIATPDGTQEQVLGAVDGVVEDLLVDGAAAIGYGVPLNIDRRTGVALRATNLPLHAVHFPSRARERYGLPAGVENDGNAAALAEWRLGAGRGASDLVMLTLGTGVGGGLVIDDRLYRGWAELGHIVVVADGQPCQGNCHGRGHLEAVASGLAADRAAAELFGPGAEAPTSRGAGTRRRCPGDRGTRTRSEGCSGLRSDRSSISSTPTS